MKNKKALYVLLPLVILLWGAIFVRIYFYITKTDENDSPISISKSNISQTNISDTFTLIANYRDPFIKERITRQISFGSKTQNTKSENKTKASTNTSRDIAAPKNTLWPKIRYCGTISNKSAGKTLVALKINDTESLFSEGETHDNVMLKKIFRDSIWIVFNNEKKCIYK